MKAVMKPGMARTLIAVLLLPALWPTLVLADMDKPAGVVTTMSGKATVSRTSLPNPLPLNFKDRVFLNDKISTAEDSIVRVLMGGRALVTIRELSVFSITEEAGKSTVDLARGKLSLAAARTRMTPGEVIEVRTPNAVAAVRGTVLVAEVQPAMTAQAGGGSGAVTSNFTVIKGTVTVANGSSPPVTLNAMQAVNVTGQTIGAVKTISPGTALQIIKSLQPPQQIAESDSDTQKKASKVEQAKALALAKALVPQSDQPKEEKGKGGQQEGQGGESGDNGQGGDSTLSDASSGATGGDGSGSIGTTATGPTGSSSTPIFSTSGTPEIVETFINPPPPPPPSDFGSGAGNPPLVIIDPSSFTQSVPLAEVAIGGPNVVLLPDPLVTTPTNPLLLVDLTVSPGTVLRAVSDGEGGVVNVPGGVGLLDSVITDAAETIIFHVGSGASATIGGSALILENSGIANSDSVIFINGSLNSTSAAPLIYMEASGLSAVNFAQVGSSGNLTLGGPLLTDVGGLVVAGEGLSVVSGGMVEAVSGQPLFSLIGSDVTIGGNLVDLAGGSLTVGGPVVELGGANLDVIGHLAEVGSGSTFTMNGPLFAGAGTLGLGGNLLNVLPGGVFNLQADATFPAPWGVANAGTFNKSGGSGAATIAGAFTNTGNVNVTSGILSLQGGSDSAGTLSISAGSTLELTGSGNHALGALNGVGSLVVNGVAGVSTATVTGLNIGATTLNSGTSILSGTTGDLTLAGGSLFAVSLTATGTVAHSAPTAIMGAGPFTVAGTYNKTAPGFVSILPTFNNTGTVNVLNGLLTLNGGGTSSGTFSVSSGAELGFSSSYTLSGGLLSGAGMATVISGVVNFGDANVFNLTGPLNIAGGTLTTFAGLLTVGAGETFAPAGTILNRTSSGTIALTGPLAQVSGTGAVLNLPTGSLFSYGNGGTFTVTSAALLQVSSGGQATISAGSLGIFGAGSNTLSLTHTLVCSSGLCLNLPGTSLKVLATGGGTASINSSFIAFQGLGGSNTVTVNGGVGDQIVAWVDGAGSVLQLGPAVAGGGSDVLITGVPPNGPPVVTFNNGAAPFAYTISGNEVVVDANNTILDYAYPNNVDRTFTSPVIELTDVALRIADPTSYLVRMNGNGESSTFNLAGSLLKATDSQIFLENDALWIFDTAAVAVTPEQAAAPLVELVNSSIEQSVSAGTQNRFLTLDGASLTLNGGSLLSLDNSSVIVGGEVLFLANATLATTGTEPLLSLTSGSVLQGGNFDSVFHVENNSTVTMAGPLLHADASTITDPGPLIFVSASMVGGNSGLPFVEVVNDSTLELTSGGLAFVESGGNLSLVGGLLAASDSTLAVSQSSPFVAVSGAGSSLIVNRTGLDLTNTSLDLGLTPVFTVDTGGRLEIGGASGNPAIRMNGGSLVAQYALFANADSSNDVKLHGSLLDLTAVTATFSDHVSNIGSDTTFSANGLGGQALVRLTDSTLSGKAVIRANTGSYGTTAVDVTGSLLDLTRSNAFLGSLYNDFGEGGTQASFRIPSSMPDVPWVRVEDSNLRFTFDTQAADLRACFNCFGGAFLGGGFPEDFYGQVLQVVGRSSVVTTEGELMAFGELSVDLHSARPLIELNGEGADHRVVLGMSSPSPMMYLAQETSVTVQGAVLGASGAAIFIGGQGVYLEPGASLSQLSSDPILSLTESLLEFGGAAVRIGQDIYASVGAAQVATSNGLLSATDSHIIAAGSFLVDVGGHLNASASSTPVVSLNGGSVHAVSVFALSGSGSPGDGTADVTLNGSVLAASNGAVVTGGSAVGVYQYGQISDAAGSASDVPLVSFESGAVLSELVLDMAGPSSGATLLRPLLKVDGVGSAVGVGTAVPLFSLDNASLTTDATTQATGFATVRNGGFLSVNGSLVSLTNSSDVTINNGSLLTVGNGAVVRVAQGASLVNFGAGSNMLNFGNPISCGGVCLETLTVDLGGGIVHEFGIHNQGGTVTVGSGFNPFPGFDGSSNNITRGGEFDDFDPDRFTPGNQTNALILVESGGTLLLGVEDLPEVHRAGSTTPLADPEYVFPAGIRYMTSPVIEYEYGEGSVTVGGPVDLAVVPSAVSHTIFGSLLQADSASIGAAIVGGPVNSLLKVEGILTSKGIGPLIELQNSTVDAGKGVVIESGGTLALNGSLVQSGSDVDWNTAGALLDVKAGGQIVVQGTQDALLNIAHGLYMESHSIATDSGAAVVSLAGGAGRETVTTPDYAISVATDQPVKHQGVLVELGGCGDCYAPVLDTESLVTVDSALLEASKPVAELLAATLNASSDVFALSNQARVTSLAPNAPFAKMGAAGFGNAIVNLAQGSFLSLSNGSLLQVLGDFLWMYNSSQLNIAGADGFLGRVSGNSILDIHGALVDFKSGSNVIEVANTHVPDFVHPIFPELTFRLTNGALAENIIIEGTPIKNAGNGSINLTGGGSLFEVSGANTKVIIRGR